MLFFFSKVFVTVFDTVKTISIIMWTKPVAFILSMIKTIFRLERCESGESETELDKTSEEKEPNSNNISDDNEAAKPNNNNIDDDNEPAKENIIKTETPKAVVKNEYMKCNIAEFNKVEKIDVQIRNVVSSILKYCKKKDQDKQKAELVLENVKPEQSEIPVDVVQNKLLRQCTKIPLVVENSRRIIVVYRKPS